MRSNLLLHGQAPALADFLAHFLARADLSYRDGADHGQRVVIPAAQRAGLTGGGDLGPPLDTREEILRR